MLFTFLVGFCVAATVGGLGKGVTVGEEKFSYLLSVPFQIIVGDNDDVHLHISTVGQLGVRAYYFTDPALF